MYLTFPTGTRVVLSGFSKSPELNGAKGELEDFFGDIFNDEFSAFSRTRQRYRVRVEGRERPVNAKPGIRPPERDFSRWTALLTR